MGYKKLIRYIILIGILILLIAIFNFFGQIEKTKSDFMNFLPKGIIALVVILITKIFIDISSKGFQEVLEKIKVDVENILKIYSYIIWFLGLLLALSILVEDLGTFLMSLGLIGFGLTFAMRTPLTCLVGWLMIIVRKPFRINDRIKVQDIEGDVVDITLMYTLLREVGAGGTEPTGRLVTFPNSMLLQEPIINYTLDVNYLWDEISVSVTYESDRKLAEKVIKECTTEVVGNIMKDGAEAMKRVSQRYRAMGRGISEYIHLTPQIRVELADSCFNVSARYIVKARHRRKIRTQIYQKILDRFKETEGIEIAYPHMEVLMHKQE